ncbi:hypothetical protein DXA10_01865 [Firmicutes bacterium AM55-24TS]|nr:hypothetical protein DXA10_01865 [Firmicutes bacterium AM55-24TS]
MVALFGTFNNQCTFFVGAVPMMSIFLELFHMTVFWIKPPLRLSGTSPQGELLRGAVEKVD